MDHQPSTAPAEIHIAGVIVHANPAQRESVSQQLLRLPGTRIHAAQPDGRMVVTLEADSTKRTLDYMDAIRALPGVLNVALVYQHAEAEEAMNEEVE